MQKTLFLFLALECLKSVFPNKINYIASFCHWNSQITVIISLVSSILVSIKNSILMEKFRLTKHWFFPWIGILITPKHIKFAITFDLTVHTKSSFSLNRDLLFPLWLQSKWFYFLGLLVRVTIFSVSSDGLLIMQKCQKVFSDMKYSQFSNSGFPIAIHLMSSFEE